MVIEYDDAVAAMVRTSPDCLVTRQVTCDRNDHNVTQDSRRRIALSRPECKTALS